VVKSDKDFDENAWSLFAEQGWLSMPFSEESGGFGFGPIELSILFEEFGKSLVIEPYLSNVVLAGSILDKSNFEGKVQLIEGICSGSSHLSLAYVEAAHSYEYLKPDTNVSEDNKLNGAKTLVLNGKNASKLIVSCVKNDEFLLVLIDTAAEGVSFNTFKTIDEKTCAEFSFENVSIEDKDIIASGDEAKNLLIETLNLATLCVSAEAVGCMISCYQKTVQYTKEREQFDQPISNFQVLQHRMVDMFIDSELAKSLLYKAMLEVDSDSEDKFKHVSALKAHVGKFGKLSAQNAIQLHGGMGVSEEMMIGHYLKKMVAIDAMFGNADFHLKAFSK
jgi:alkylation response protein AidB-like acyl-CoA dehydrogenase